MLYNLGKPLVRFILRQFFRNIVIKGAPLESGAAVVVSNHPNFMLDSLIIASAFKRELWFLAKATIFRGWLRTWLLSSLHVIPVHRKQDNPDDTVKNEDTFRRATDVLSRSGGIVIFPEGISAGELRVLPLKTGAARIAFQAEANARFGLGLKVQPVGITYTDLSLFRSSVTVVFGEPFDVSSLRNEYELNAIEAVRSFTDRIEGWLKDVSVEVKDRAFDSLVIKIGKVFESAGSELDDHERLRVIAKNVDSLAPSFPQKRQELEGKIESYLELSDEMRLASMGSLEAQFDRLHTVLITPFVILGIILHYVPYRITDHLAHKTAKRPVELSSFKFSIGTITFLVWYLLIFMIAALVCSSLTCAMLVTLIVLITGYYVNNYLHHLRLFVLSCLWPGSSSPLEILRLMRDELIAELNALRLE